MKSNDASGVIGVFEQLPLPRWLTFNQAATQRCGATEPRGEASPPRAMRYPYKHVRHVTLICAWCTECLQL